MKPWEKQGISRATWYRRKAIGEEMTPRQISSRIAQLEAQNLIKSSKAKKLEGEISDNQVEIFMLKQRLVGLKWP